MGKSPRCIIITAESFIQKLCTRRDYVGDFDLKKILVQIMLAVHVSPQIDEI